MFRKGSHKSEEYFGTQHRFEHWYCDKTQTIHVLVGSGKRGDGPDGDPLACQLARPHGVFIDKEALYVGDSENHRVRVVKR